MRVVVEAAILVVFLVGVGFFLMALSRLFKELLR